ncbi:MarR family winged helix-turn-helix transcriptional regulator [Epilithonimonas sp.]|uniref:MarR family winged helix-turn-helix transcriptional regulator n=1 Tax=Epilithonimonas sp. TaxID=2894511 RepID=UPI0028A08798|nr:MarR family winged helix-turn-helix transcriptional regulator [Epilithonimonas sp.]
MNYEMALDSIKLLEQFAQENTNMSYPNDINGFKSWICDTEDKKIKNKSSEPYWEGKESGRTPESAITTLLLHLSKYAKTYSRSAISDSDFVTQEDFIYLINLKAFGGMSKTDLIKKNIQEKPVGMLIINRLIKKGFIQQLESNVDKRKRLISISDKGLSMLEEHMGKIRKATQIVTGDLNQHEKMELIRILNKLDRFHYPIFSRNIQPRDLIRTVYEEYSFKN